MALPLELLLRIIDLVNERDTKTLRNCALVCSALRIHCQRHLFAKLRQRFSTVAGWERLAQVLEGRPQLGSYVKSLSIFIVGCDHPVLPRILSICPNVAALTLQAAKPRRVWTKVVSVETQSAVRQVLSSPNLTELTIISFQLPISTFFSHCSTNSLRCLRFHVEPIANPPHSNQVKELGRGSPIALRELHVSPASGLEQIFEARLESGQSVFDLSQLQRFALFYYADGYVKTHESVEMLKIRGADDFEGLLLLLFDRYSSVEDIFTQREFFPFFSTLRHIRTSLMHLDGDHAQPWGPSFRGLVSGLHSFPNDNVLEDVTITLFMGDYSELLFAQAQGVWVPNLVSVFKTRSFPCLKTINVLLDVDFWEYDQQECLVVFLDTLSFAHLDLTFSFIISASWEY